MSTDQILYRQVKSVKAGQIERFEINYTPNAPLLSPSANLWVKVKNKEPLPMRAAFIAGPYMLYVDCRSEDYNWKQKCFITAEQPCFESQLQPGKSFYAELSCHTIKDNYKWTVDVISQMIFNSNVEINFEIIIGTSKDILSAANFLEVPNSDRVGVFDPDINVHNLDTFDLWNLPVPNPTKPIHLVVLTHGLHSNVSADMLFLKEQIDGSNSDDSRDSVIVKGFFGNICKTERGIKYLGSRVAEFVIDLVQNNELYNNGKVQKISFVGHSLGGLVQTFAIAYLQFNFPWFFKKIKPINFVTIASPLLGASNENPIYVNLALLAGIVGKTGQDLSLRFTEDASKPLLLLLPSGPTHTILKKFVRRTVYANVANDGVVPLRTSALLYLDFDGLSKVSKHPSVYSGSEVDKIPEDDTVDLSQSYLPQPVQMILAKFMPQKQLKPRNDDDLEGEVEEEGTKSLKTRNFLQRIEGLHQSSMLETAQSLILPPLPTMGFIVNPDERKNVIEYDKVYHEKDLPARDGNSTPVTGEIPKESSNITSISGGTEPAAPSFRKRLMSSIDSQEFERIEEEIAREYHKGMSWRKVLVRLDPDAHNNIIVRRRFANAYGWPVIDHLIENHFNVEEELPSHWNLNGIGLIESDSLSDSLELTDVLARDLIKRENRDIEENPVDNHKWINHKDAENFFTVGPAGLMSDVSDMVGNLRDQWFKSQDKKLSTREKAESNGVPEFTDVQNSQVMGDFI